MSTKIVLGGTCIELRDAPAPQWPVVEILKTWRPIESAPQDGSWILACGAWGGPRGERGNPMAVRWCAPSPSFEEAKAWRNQMLIRQDLLTHWMPLLPPPGPTP